MNKVIGYTCKNTLVGYDFDGQASELWSTKKNKT